MRGLAERRERDRRPGGLLGARELVAAAAQAGLGDALERPHLHALELAAALGHPRPLAVGQERLALDRERVAGVGDGPRPVLPGERLGRALHRGGRRLGVDPDRLGEHEPQLRATRERGRLGHVERAAELGEQGGEGRLGRGRRVLGPQQVDQLVTRARSLAVVDQEGEQQPPLATRQAVLEPPPAGLHDDPAAQADVPLGLCGHRRLGPCRHRLLNLSPPPRFLQAFAKWGAALFCSRHGPGPPGRSRSDSVASL